MVNQIASYGEDKSHSTRVRGLKSRSYGMGSEKRFVALYTSAWIEMRSASVAEPGTLGRTLHECVD